MTVKVGRVRFEKSTLAEFGPIDRKSAENGLNTLVCFDFVPKDH